MLDPFVLSPADLDWFAAARCRRRPLLQSPPLSLQPGCGPVRSVPCTASGTGSSVHRRPARAPFAVGVTCRAACSPARSARSARRHGAVPVGAAGDAVRRRSRWPPESPAREQSGPSRHADGSPSDARGRLWRPSGACSTRSISSICCCDGGPVIDTGRAQVESLISEAGRTAFACNRRLSGSGQKSPARRAERRSRAGRTRANAALHSPPCGPGRRRAASGHGCPARPCSAVAAACASTPVYIRCRMPP